MTHTPSFVVRAISSVAAFALAMTGLSVLAIAPAAAASTLVYDSIPATTVPAYPSLGFQATSTDEFGSYVRLAGADRVVTNVTVGLTDWACGNWSTINEPSVPCATTPGTSFNHDITLNFYKVDNSGALPQPGALIASVTEQKAIPYRPSSSPTECTGTNLGKWWDAATAQCYNGYAFDLTFDFTGDDLVLPTDVMVAVAYNTQSHGAAPMVQPGPYNSLNVSIQDSASAVTVGSPENADEMLVDSTWTGNYTDAGAGGLDTLRTDTGWTGYVGLVLEINADNALLPAPTNAVTVYDKDVAANETSGTYTSWHEDKPTAAPSNASVHPDGLHLGDGGPIRVIKGEDLSSPAPISQSDLRSLILSSSVDVVSGSVTMQVPVYFGLAGSPSYTTLRSSSLAGAPAHKTFSLADTWVTSQPIGSSYTAGATAPLSDLLAAVYAHAASVGGGVALAGYGVQADTSAVVSKLVWGDNAYTFFQPEVQACTPTVPPAASNLSSQGWTFGETRSQGHNVFLANGLHVYTESDTSLDKAAGYKAIDVPLASIGTVGIEFAPGFTARPGLQLGFDKDGDGGFDGYLVGEPWDYHASGDGWSSGTNGDWNKAQFWNSNVALGLPDGAGYPNLGTLNDYLLYYPTAKVTSYGYSLGSGVHGDSVITSITAGCQSSTFTTASAPAAGTGVNVSELDIRPNEASYPGWHEGYTNAARAYSVLANGLHLGDGVHSQILFGLDAPLASSGLESIITGSSVDVVSGSVSLQFPVTYGVNNNFTTLRSESLATTGVRGVAVTDVWVTTRDILAANGTTVLVPAGGKLPVADFAVLLNSLTNVRLLGYGVQADSSAVVKNITANGTTYTFVPYVAPPVTSTVRVPESDIRPDEASYPGWHEGYTNATKSYSVDETGLSLGAPLHSQVINGLAAPLTSPTVAVLVAGASVDVASGSVTYQVPVYYGSGTDFTTLRSASLSAGSHSFTLQSLWASSKSIPALSIVAHQLYPLGDLLDKLANVRVLGFGVQADAAAKISSLVFNQVEYQFAGPLVPGVAAITGTPTVGQTLTANPGTWTPFDATFTYQWKSNGSAISGATGATYTLTGDDALDNVVVVVTGHHAGYADTSATSAGVPIAQGTLTTGVPTITGTAAIGSTLTAVPGTWGPAPVTFTYQWLSDGVPIPGATGSTHLITYSDAGNSLSVTVTGAKTGYTTVSVLSAPTLSLPTSAVPVVDRIFGANRYATAAAISQGFPADVHRVYIASGVGFADALSAAPAAAHLDAPLLLTQPDAVPAVVITELQRLSPDEIIVVGSSASISTGVFAQLQSLGFHPNVQRLGGANRFETSRMIAAEAFPSAATVYIASGLNFPDALSAGPAAAKFDGPVVLVNGPAASLDNATLTLLASLHVATIKIAGSALSVSSGIEAQLDVLYDIERNGGVNRFETAVKINEDEFTSASTIYLASGLNFPDALAGAARAGYEGAPMYISMDTCIPEAVMESIIKLDPAKIVLLGGTPSLNAAVEHLEVCN